MNRLGMAFLFVAAGVFSGCGGGGGDDDDNPQSVSYTGSNDPAAITIENSQTFAEAAADASNQMVQEYKADDANPYTVAVTGTSASSLKSRAGDIGLMIIKNSQVAQLPVGVTRSYEELDPTGETFCGGSITISDSLADASEGQESGSGTVTFDNLCVIDFDGLGHQAYMNGSMEISWDPTYSRIAFQNLTVTGADGQVLVAVNGEISCTTEGEVTTCTEASYYEKAGVTYKVADAEVFGDDVNGWNATATVYHPNHGYVTVQATGMKYECTNGHPSAGTVTIADESGSSVWVNFTSCDTYYGEYSLNPPDGLTGSFEGW